MGTKRRLVAAAGATAAMVLLRPEGAMAGTSTPPDQQATNTFYVEVTTFITCQVDVEVQRSGSLAFFTTRVVTDEPECLDNAMSVYGELTATDGSAITASSGGSGFSESLSVGGVSHVSRTIHAINFAACNCGQTVELHPK